MTFAKPSVPKFALILISVTGIKSMAQICQPNYQIVEDRSCAGKILTTWSKQVEKLVNPNSGDCKDFDRMCTDYGNNLANFRGENPEALSATFKSYKEKDSPADGLCGGRGDFEIRGIKKKITCTYDVNLPFHCPPEAATDANSCFVGNGPVNISPRLLRQCLDIRISIFYLPDEDAQLWQKATCLVDILNAYDSSRLPAGMLNDPALPLVEKALFKIRQDIIPVPGRLDNLKNFLAPLRLNP